jgi:hypothetical protein
MERDLLAGIHLENDNGACGSSLGADGDPDSRLCGRIVSDGEGDELNLAETRKGKLARGCSGH